MAWACFALLACTLPRQTRRPATTHACRHDDDNLFSRTHHTHLSSPPTPPPSQEPSKPCGPSKSRHSWAPSSSSSPPGPALPSSFPLPTAPCPPPSQGEKKNRNACACLHVPVCPFLWACACLYVLFYTLSHATYRMSCPLSVTAWSGQQVLAPSLPPFSLPNSTSTPLRRTSTNSLNAPFECAPCLHRLSHLSISTPLPSPPT